MHMYDNMCLYVYIYVLQHTYMDTHTYTHLCMHTFKINLDSMGREMVQLTEELPGPVQGCNFKSTNPYKSEMWSSSVMPDFLHQDEMQRQRIPEA